MILPPLRGTIDRTEMTDRGVRYMGKDSEGNDLSVDANVADMTVNAGGRLILLGGDYLERDDNARKYFLYNKSDDAFIDFSVDDDGHFILKYGHRGRPK